MTKKDIVKTTKELSKKYDVTYCDALGNDVFRRLQSVNFNRKEFLISAVKAARNRGLNGYLMMSNLEVAQTK